MPGEPAEPLSAERPSWVGLAPRLAFDAGEAPLRPDDAAHVRMLRHLGARALHEPLLALLPGGPDPSAPRSLVGAAGRALRALLPGNPKPVAALTRSPEVTGLLLRALALEGARAAEGSRVNTASPAHAEGALRETLEQLAAQVLFSLALASALHEPVTLAGPLRLEHALTRRGLVLPAGSRLALARASFALDGHPLDPWGPELGRLLTTHAGLCVERAALDALGELPAALALVRARDPAFGRLREVFDALELASANRMPPSPPGAPLPLAVGRARVPAHADAESLARALLCESLLHELTLLRLVDPLVRDERELHHLAQAADAWAARRLGIPPAPLAEPSRDAAGLTPLGARVLAELSA